MREYITKIELTGKIHDQVLSNIDYDELVVRDALLTNVTFNNCKFNNSYIGFNTQYKTTKFINCTFKGKYSSFGEPRNKLTTYNDCTFKNCKIIGLEILNGTIFTKCCFSGLLKNVILRDASGKLPNFGTQFNNCDLSELLFDNISIYGKNLFNNTLLPNSGIIKLDNRDDKLITKAESIINQENKNDLIDLQVIFDKKTHSGQIIVIIDQLFLNKFLKSNKSKILFERIIEGHIINGGQTTANKA